jgi:hypothetical protein
MKNIILKARQKGITKIINADQLVDCLVKPTNAVVISHEKEATRRLFRAVKFFIDKSDYRIEVSIDNANEILFPKTNSSYYIGTAGSKAFGRGDQLHRSHLSEAAFYPDLETLLAGVSEATEHGEINIESTPNGRGNYFYDLWEKAKRGQSPYTPIFIPWFIDSEYSVDALSAEEKAGMSDMVQEMFSVPDSEFELNDEELDLAKRVKAEWNIDLSIGQFKWRRYKIWDKGMLFFQEYPEDDVSCFLQSGRPVFREITLKPELKLDLDALLDAKDDASIELVQTLKKGKLFAGLDGAEGNQGGDNHCFAVIDFSSQKGVACYEITSTDPIEVFDAKVAKLVKALNIRLLVEKQGIGSAHVMKLKSLGCPFQVWNTTGASRPIMITELEEAYRKGDLIETYNEAKNEALDIFWDSTNRATHPQGKHDDRVFARAIAWQARKMPQPRVS